MSIYNERDEVLRLTEIRERMLQGGSGWYLRITEKDFHRLFDGLIDIRIFKEGPVDEEDLFDNFMTSKLWRLNNLYTIVLKEGDRLPFLMKFGQMYVYAEHQQHPRILILKSRQQGISTMWLIYFFDDAVLWPDLSIGLMAQGLEESEGLLTRTKTAWESLDPNIVEFLGIGNTQDNSKGFGFSNGSIIKVRTSFRSATLQRLHISEYGKICNEQPKKAQETKSGTMQAIKAGLPIVIESTAEGDNDFKNMWDKAIVAEAKVKQLGTGRYAAKDFKPVFLSWLDDPDCVSDVYEEPTKKQTAYFDKLEAELNRTISEEQRNFWIMQERELPDKIYQEYPATPDEAFAKVNDGCYYATHYVRHVIQRNRRIRKLYDPNLEVNVAMDLGIRESDIFTLVFFQVFNNEWRIIDEYTNYNEGLDHYVNYINDTGYYINWYVCPHDIKVRELGTDGGLSRYDSLRKLGVKKIMVLKKAAVADGIELVRQMIKNMWIDESCEYTHDCLMKYTKIWDDIKQTWKQQANHNQWSHGADALRYMAMSGVKRMVKYASKAEEMQIKRRKSGVYDGMCL